MTPPTTSAKKRFLFYALILFTAIVLLVGAGVLSVWLPYHREQTAIAEIEAAGGKVDTDFGGPELLRGWNGNEYIQVFHRVISVDLSHKQIDDGILNHLSDLRELETIELINTHVTDAGLEQLAGLTSLTDLYLDNTQITDAGLEQLTGLTNLEWLWIENTQITDAGLEHLAGLTKLRWLTLDNTRVTRKGVEKLQKAIGDNCDIRWTPPVLSKH